MTSRMDFGLKEIFDFFPFAPIAEFAQALPSIWRIRSRVTLKCWPTSSRVTGTAVFEAEAQVEDLAFPVSQTGKDVFDLFFQQDEGGSVVRGDGFRVFDEVAEVGIFFFAIGVSRDTGSWAIFMISRTRSTGMSIFSAISSGNVRGLYPAGADGKCGSAC